MGPERRRLRGGDGVRRRRGLPATEAGAERLRLVVEGAAARPLTDSARLRTQLELGGRWDGGYVDKGYGAEIGGSVAYQDTERGIEGEVRGRYLLAHQSDGFEERGASLTVAVRPRRRWGGAVDLVVTAMGRAGERGGSAVEKRAQRRRFAFVRRPVGDAGGLPLRRVVRRNPEVRPRERRGRPQLWPGVPYLLVGESTAGIPETLAAAGGSRTSRSSPHDAPLTTAFRLGSCWDRALLQAHVSLEGLLLPEGSLSATGGAAEPPGADDPRELANPPPFRFELHSSIRRSRPFDPVPAA